MAKILPFPKDDDTSYILTNRQDAMLRAMDASETDPDDAARAHALSQATGVPPTIVQQDQDGFEDETKRRLTANLIQANPHLQSYVNSHPLAASISNDDWGALHDLSKAMGSVAQSTTLGGRTVGALSAAGTAIEKAYEGLGAIHSAGIEEATKEAEEARKAAVFDPFEISPTARQAHPNFAAVIDMFASTPLGSAARYSAETVGGPIGLISMIGGDITGYLYGVAKKLGAPDNLARDIAGMAEAEMGGLTGRAHVGEPAGEIVRRMREDSLAREGAAALQLAKPFLDKGEIPPAGLHPYIDTARAIMSKIDGDALERATKLAQGTNTWARDKEFQLEHFLSLWPDSHIEIPADAVRQLYGAKLPEPDDGILGWVPNLQEQLEASALTGEKVEIPRSLWITHADPEIRKALKEDAAWRPGAMSEKEADATLKAAPDMMKERPPQETGMGPFVDGMYRVAGLEPPDQMVERLSPVEAAGLDFRNVIPEGSESIHTFPSTGPKGEPTTPTGTHFFKLGDVLPKLYRGQLEHPARVLSEFFGKQLERLASDVPVHVITPEEMLRVQPENPLGYYDPNNHHIVLRSDIVDGSHPSYFTTEVVMHEAEHAISTNAIHKFKPIQNYLEKLRKYTLNYLKGMGDVGVQFTAQHSNAFKNEKEFLVEAKSNVYLQDMLHRIPLNQELAVGLRIPRGTMWDAVRLIVKQLWTNIAGKVPTESVMDAIFRSTHALEDINARLEQSKAERAQLKPEFAKKEPPTPEEGELFAAKALGMSQRVYRAMRDLALKRRDERARLLAEQAQKEEAERQTKDWKDNEAVIRELVQDHVMRLPDIAADHFLRTGELFGVKYRRARLDGNFITDKSGLDTEHWNPTQGLRPDAIAEALGFQSGDQMIQALRNLKSIRDAEGLTPSAYITKMVDALTDREMKERYGTFEQQVLNAAKEHIFGETQYDILHEHTLRFAEQLGMEKVGFTKDDVRAWARLRMQTLRVGKIDSTRAMKEVGDLGRMIEGAEATGDWDTAFKISQQREIAFQVAKMQMKAEKTIEKFKRRATQFRKREPGAVGIEWSNAIQDILQRIGVAVNRTPEDIAGEYVRTGNGSLRDFVNANSLPEIFEPDGDFPATSQSSLTVAGFLLDPTYRAENGWKEMNWEEFEAVHNSIDSLYVNGRKAKNIELGGEVADREQLITDLVSIVHEVFKSDDQEDMPIDKANTLQTLWAGLIQMETLWTRLARGDKDNLFMKMINMPTMAAGNHISTLERQYSREYANIGRFPKQMLKTVENPYFFEPNERGGEIADRPMKMTMRNLLAILQNVGNWSNFDKLTRGYGIENAQAREMWRKGGYQMWMNDPVMNWIFKNTTKKDWDRAQALGDLFEKIFSESETIYYNMGARPGPRIELRPIETPFGTYKGWYHPIIYDSQRPMFWTYDPDTGERTPVSKTKATNPMDEAGIYHVATPAGYQKSRTGYAAPLLLNFDAIPFRMKQMINDIAMRPVVTELNKIFSDPRFQTAMTKTYGQQYSQLLKPYLRDIAGQRRYVDPIAVTGGRIAEYIYTNLVSTLIGFNPGTVLKHFPTALMNSVNEVGAGAFWKEFGMTWLNPLGWKNVGWVLNKSDEVARRSRNYRESLTGAYEELFPGGTPAPLSGVLGENWGSKVERARQAMIKAGATPVAWSDLASVVPMWNVVYKAEKRAGSSEGAAIRAADMSVRRAHGSTAPTARAAVMRTGWGRAITPFYTFFNDMLQRQYETAWRAKDAVGYLKDGNYQKGADEMKKVAAGVWTYVIFPAIVEQAISPIHWDPDDDNYVKQGSEIIAKDVASSFPIIRDLASLATEGRDPTFSIYGTGLMGIRDFVHDIERGEVSLSDEKAGKTIKHTATMIGTALGLMNAQMGRWGQFAYDYASGKQDPEGPLTMEGLPQWYRALRFGDIKERKK